MISETAGLEALAEISIAFAGFASIVTVLGRPARDAAWLNAIRIRGMIANATIAALGALVPFGVLGYGLVEASAWKVATLVLLLLSTLNVVVASLDARRSLPRLRAQAIGPPWWQMAVVGLGVSIPPALCLYSLTLTEASILAANYRLALLIHLFVAAAMFVGLLTSILAPTVESE